jgi:aldehyde:ferredoxin oxidoreductase
MLAPVVSNNFLKNLVSFAGMNFFSVRNYVTPTKEIRPVGIVELFNASTGLGYDLEALILAGERIVKGNCSS